MIFEDDLSIKDTDIGEIVYCYDPRTWDKKEDAISLPRREAKIIAIHRGVECCKTFSPHTHAVIVDVQFLDDVYVSKGHFPSALIRKVNYELSTV